MWYWNDWASARCVNSEGLCCWKGRWSWIGYPCVRKEVWTLRRSERQGSSGEIWEMRGEAASTLCTLCTPCILAHCRKWVSGVHLDVCVQAIFCPCLFFFWDLVPVSGSLSEGNGKLWLALNIAEECIFKWISPSSYLHHTNQSLN